jgi:hypothetical protein
MGLFLEWAEGSFDPIRSKLTSFNIFTKVRGSQPLTNEGNGQEFLAYCTVTEMYGMG